MFNLSLKLECQLISYSSYRCSFCGVIVGFQPCSQKNAAYVIMLLMYSLIAFKPNWIKRESSRGS